MKPRITKVMSKGRRPTYIISVPKEKNEPERIGVLSVINTALLIAILICFVVMVNVIGKMTDRFNNLLPDEYTTTTNIVVPTSIGNRTPVTPMVSKTDKQYVDNMYNKRIAKTVKANTVKATPAPVTPVVNEQKFEELNIELSVELQKYTFELCVENKIPFELMISLMWQESKYVIDEVSEDGRDFGLCQIRDVNFAFLATKGITDLFNPEQNIKAAIILITPFIEKYGNQSMHLPLMCYNMGEAGARRFWKEDIYSTDYTKKVLTYMEENIL